LQYLISSYWKLKKNYKKDMSQLSLKLKKFELVCCVHLCILCFFRFPKEHLCGMIIILLFIQKICCPKWDSSKLVAASTLLISMECDGSFQVFEKIDATSPSKDYNHYSKSYFFWHGQCRSRKRFVSNDRRDFYTISSLCFLFLLQ